MSDGGLGWNIDSATAAHVVRPAGRVDESTATEFADRLLHEIGAAKADGKALLALDLSQVAYMSSRGLRALTLAQRNGNENGVKIALSEPNDIMREILAISRYDMIFPVFERTADAIAG
ncbi:STAS domain-containing protein [Sphingomonas sp. HDW15A]|nr:STAS domain-containing protein [Sphingomonas sp. HDW15A]